MKVSSIEKSIYQLDSDVRIKYKISMNEIEEIIEAIGEKSKYILIIIFNIISPSPITNFFLIWKMHTHVTNAKIY